MVESASRKTKASARGRPKLPPVEKARREALKAKRQLEEADSEFFERLAIEETNSERAGAVKLVANRRMRHAKTVNDARKKLSQARADVKKKVPGAKIRYEEARDEEKEAWEKFRALPDLGFTQEEWDDPNAVELRKRQMGRPQLDVEIKRVRAKEALDEAMERVKQEEAAAGVEHVPLSKLKDPVKESKGKGVGRPKLDRLGVLDRRVNQLEKKLERIKSGKEKGSNSSSPRAMSPTAKLRKTKMEIEDLRKLIQAEEAKLDDKGRIKRQLKRLRDERRRMTLAIRNNPGASEAEQKRHQWLSERIEERLAELQGLEEVQQQPAGAQAKRGQAHGVDEATRMEAEDINPAAVAARPAGLGEIKPSPEIVRRQAIARAKAAEIDARSAQTIEKLYKDFDPEMAATLAAAVEEKRRKERAMIDDIELLEGAAA